MPCFGDAPSSVDIFLQKRCHLRTVSSPPVELSCSQYRYILIIVAFVELPASWIICSAVIFAAHCSRSLIRFFSRLTCTSNSIGTLSCFVFLSCIERRGPTFHPVPYFSPRKKIIKKCFPSKKHAVCQITFIFYCNIQ